MTNDFDQAETFRPVANLAKGSLQNGLILFIFLGLVTWLLVTVITNGLGLPVPWLFGIVLSVPFCVVGYRLKGQQLDKLVEGMALTFSPQGITENPSASRFVSWDGLRDARPVKPIVANALASVAAAEEPGLVGIGTIEMSADAKAMVRETYKQNAGRNGVDGAAAGGAVPVPVRPQLARRSYGRVDRALPSGHLRRGKGQSPRAEAGAVMNLRDFTRAEWAKAKAEVAAEKAEADEKGPEGSELATA